MFNKADPINYAYGSLFEDYTAIHVIFNVEFWPPSRLLVYRWGDFSRRLTTRKNVEKPTLQPSDPILEEKNASVSARYVNSYEILSYQES